MENEKNQLKRKVEEIGRYKKSKEDCKVLTEDVATIKHHLDHSNMSEDLDESMNFELPKNSLPGSPQSKKCNMPDIQEERTSDVYMAYKNDCYHYYFEKTGIEKDNLTCNLRMIEVMKLLHENLILKHGNELLNLVNQLNDHQETYTSLQTLISVMQEDHDKIKKDLEKKDHSFNIITNVVTQLRENLRLIKPIDTTQPDLKECTKVLDELKDKFFDILDKNFNLSSVHIFKQITGHMNKLLEDYSCVRDTLTQVKYNLCEKEKECNVLKAENDKIRDINHAVTLDIIKIKEFNKNIIEQTYQKLVKLNMISPDIVTTTEPVNIHVLIRLLEHFINEYQKEKAKGDNSLEINGYKVALADKEKLLNELHLQNVLLQSSNRNNAKELSLKDDEINNLKKSLTELNITMTINEKETAQNQILIQTLSEEIRNLKDNITNKEKMLATLNNTCAKVIELMSTVQNLQDDKIKLSVNEMIPTETNLYASELEKSCATIKQNNIDIDKMTSDILALRESLKEISMEKLKQEVQTLSKEYVEVKQELEIKSRDCSRLEINIKTHEKTAEDQNRMIMRLQKPNEEVDSKRSNDLTEKYAALQAEVETSRNTIKTLNEELEHLRTARQSLENRLAEAEDGRRSRLSIDAITDSSKQRRQSLHDSKRMFEEMEGWTNLHAVVVDRMSYDAEVEKNKKLAKTIEELHCSKLELNNTIAQMQQALKNYSAISLADYFSKINYSRDLEQTKKQLKAYNDELQQLRVRYKELGEECEPCANYLKEREEQCRKLKDANAALEAKVKELQEKSQAIEHTKSVRKKRQTIHDMNRPETSADQRDASTETIGGILSSQMKGLNLNTQRVEEWTRDLINLKKMVGRLTQQKMHLEMQLRAAQSANPMFVVTGSAIVQSSMENEKNQLKRKVEEIGRYKKSKEDCKVLTEDVATIKHHLDHSNMSEDLDESMNFELPKNSLPGSPQSKKCNMPDIQEERTSDVYMAYKNDCYHYYFEKTGIEKDNLTCNLRMIEVMKLLHENLILKHGNELLNLVNQLNDHQETYTSLQTLISVMQEDHDKIKKDLEKKDHSFNIITNVVTQLRENLRLIKPIDTTQPDLKECTKVLDELKDKFFDILDKNFNLSSVHIFKQITGHMNKLLEDYSCVRDTLTQVKYNLCEKEKECDVLKAENDKIRDINHAVTLDIIKIKEFNKNIIEQTYQKLVKLNMISPDIVTTTEPVNIHVLIRLLEHFINEYQKEKAKGDNSLEINGYKVALADKEKLLNELHLQNVLLQSSNRNNAKELSLKDDEINNLKKSLTELNITMTINEKETAQNQILIQTLSEEIRNLKDNITNKEKMLATLNNTCAKVIELMSTVQNLQDDKIKLSVNEMIPTETNLYASELEKSCATIKQNNIDIDKMTSDILALRESLKEISMEKLKQEVQTLSKEYVEVKQELEIKSRDCSRLEINIKTHEKTAEDQNRMIMRLQKPNEEVDSKRSNDLTEKYAALQAEVETSRNTIKTLNEELEHLRTARQSFWF